MGSTASRSLLISITAHKSAAREREGWSACGGMRTRVGGASIHQQINSTLKTASLCARVCKGQLTFNASLIAFHLCCYTRIQSHLSRHSDATFSAHISYMLQLNSKLKRKIFIFNSMFYFVRALTESCLCYWSQICFQFAIFFLLIQIPVFFFNNSKKYWNF